MGLEFFDDYGIAVAGQQRDLLDSIDGCLEPLRVSGELRRLTDEFDLR